MPKYIVYPGFIGSDFDGSKHFISGYDLIRLYKLPFEEVIIANKQSDVQGLDLQAFVHLYPVYDGDYNY